MKFKKTVRGKKLLELHNKKSVFKRSTWANSSHSENEDRGKKWLKKEGYTLTSANCGNFTDQVEINGEIHILYTSTDVYTALYSAGLIAWKLHSWEY